MNSIGIDVGKGSFICVIGDDITFERIPSVSSVVDIQALYKIIRGLQGHVVIEDVHAIYGSSAKATFEFGRISGIIEALVVSCGLPYTKVAPKEWQFVS